MDELEWGQLVKPIAEGDAEPDGSEWDVTIATAGTSNNRRRYSAAVLKEAAPLYDGARVLVRSDEDHVANKATSVQNIVGWISAPRYDEATTSLVGRLHLSESASHVKSLLLDAWRRGKRDLVGLSHVVDGERKFVREGGQIVEAVSRIVKVRTVDLVVNPAAGGGFVRLVASEGKEVPSVDPEKLFAMLKEADNSVVRGLLKGKDEAFITSISEADEALGKKIAEALAEEDELTEAEKAEQAKVDKAAADKATLTEADKAKAEAAEKAKTLTEADTIPAYMTKMVVKGHLAEAEGLPDVVKTRIEKRFAGKATTETEITEAIDEELVSWKELEKDGLVQSRSGARGDTGVVVEALDAYRASLTGFFMDEDIVVNGHKVPRFRSFKEAYIRGTGDEKVTGMYPERATGALGLEFGRSPGRAPRMAEADNGKAFTLAEANGLITTQFDQVAQDAMHLKLIRDYRMSTLRTWDPLVDIVPISDFRTQHSVRTGGYGDLPTVAENGSYTAQTSPTDEEATYSLAKKGGTDFVTLEMIANDSVGAIRRIPTKFARAASRTLAKFIYNTLIATNPTIYDTLALAHTTHANKGTTALGVASLNAARVAMLKQTEKDSSEVIGLYPEHLYVPIDLEQTAFELTNSSLKPYTNDNESNFLHAQTLDYTVVPFWSDTNDWWAFAGKEQTPIIELGFYGSEEPELFVQDMPNVGSVFTNDRITWKVRFIFGGANVEYRGTYGAIVP